MLNLNRVLVATIALALTTVAIGDEAGEFQWWTVPDLQPQSAETIALAVQPAELSLSQAIACGQLYAAYIERCDAVVQPVRARTHISSTEPVDPASGAEISLRVVTAFRVVMMGQRTEASVLSDQIMAILTEPQQLAFDSSRTLISGYASGQASSWFSYFGSGYVSLERAILETDIAADSRRLALAAVSGSASARGRVLRRFDEEYLTAKIRSQLAVAKLHPEADWPEVFPLGTEAFAVEEAQFRELIKVTHDRHVEAGMRAIMVGLGESDDAWRIWCSIVAQRVSSLDSEAAWARGATEWLARHRDQHAEAGAIEAMREELRRRINSVLRCCRDVVVADDAFYEELTSLNEACSEQMWTLIKTLKEVGGGSASATRKPVGRFIYTAAGEGGVAQNTRWTGDALIVALGAMLQGRFAHPVDSARWSDFLDWLITVAAVPEGGAPIETTDTRAEGRRQVDLLSPDNVVRPWAEYLVEVALRERRVAELQLEGWGVFPFELFYLRQDGALDPAVAEILLQREQQRLDHLNERAAQSEGSVDAQVALFDHADATVIALSSILPDGGQAFERLIDSYLQAAVLQQHDHLIAEGNRLCADHEDGRSQLAIVAQAALAVRRLQRRADQWLLEDGEPMAQVPRADTARLRSLRHDLRREAAAIEFLVAWDAERDAGASRRE